MASNANTAMTCCCLFVAGLAVMAESVAAAGDLSTSPTASLNATTTGTTTVTIKDRTIEWLKITAVPLSVFLVGACLWGLIKSTTAWKNCTGRGGESGAPRANQVRPAV